MLILMESEVAKAVMEQLRSRLMLQSVDPLFRDRNVVLAERKGSHRGFSQKSTSPADRDIDLKLRTTSILSQ